MFPSLASENNGMLSAVIPTYNECQSLAELHRQLSAVARDNQYDLQIIFVDDGSVDDSWRVICELAQIDPRVMGIRFRRNFGKAAALTAGFRAARGDRIMTLDADLQDDPAEIPRFLAALDEGRDVVSGWKKIRHDPWHKVIPSRIFNWLVSWMTGVKLHDHNCGMKCLSAQAVREIRVYGELHRFIPVLANARGFRVGEIVIQHRARQFGRSKYGFRRFIRGFLDLFTVVLLTGYGRRPQHLFGSIGLMSFLLGVVGLIYLAGYWLVGQMSPELQLTPLHQRPLVIYSACALLFGGQMLSIGAVAELITAQLTRDCDSYAISETTNPAGDGDEETQTLHVDEARG